MNPKDSFSCSVEYEVSEGSVLLKVIPANGPPSTSEAIVPSRALLPLSISSYRTSRSMSYGIRTTLSRSFQHCFQSHARPIPHFLHPDVEGPTEEPDAPYTITFTERQYISAEGASEGPRWTTSLMYICHEKRDQILLCEMIFGKTLLMIAGSDKIKYDGQEVSHMSAIALWFDDASKTRSMTFSPILGGKKTTSKDIELKFHDLWDPHKARRDPKTLTLIAEPMPIYEEDLNLSDRSDRQSSVQSECTFFSKASSTTSQRWKKLKFTINFSRSSDVASFLNYL